MPSSRRLPSRRGVVMLVAVGVLGLCDPPCARSSEPEVVAEYDVKAVFIHHLTRYLRWPQPEPAERFEIAVLGDSPIVLPLEAIAVKETIRGRPIAIRPLADLDSLGRPQVLFVAKPARSHLSRVLERTRGLPIVTIAEEEGFAAQGIAVNFVLRGESIRLEINESALRASEIEPGAQLLKLAILVGGRR